MEFLISIPISAIIPTEATNDNDSPAKYNANNAPMMHIGMTLNTIKVDLNVLNSRINIANNPKTVNTMIVPIPPNDSYLDSLSPAATIRYP